MHTVNLVCKLQGAWYNYCIGYWKLKIDNDYGSI